MGKMALKVAKIRMQILNHGNKEGFSIVEASLSLLIASLLLLAVLGFIRLSVVYSSREINKIENCIQNQNIYAEKNL